MSDLKYDQFYVRHGELEGLHYFHEAIHKDDFGNTCLKDEFKEVKMYCPECEICELKFISGTSQRRAFLSKLQSSRHTTECSFACDEMPRRELVKYYDEVSDEQIKNRLNAMIRYLERQNNPLRDKKPIQQKSNPFLEETHDKNAARIKQYRRIMSRSIYELYDIEKKDYGLPILLYGDVILTKEDGRGCHHILKIWDKTGASDRYIRYFPRNEFEDKDLVSGAKYHLAMVCVLGEGKNGLICIIYNGNSIMYAVYS